MRSFKKQSQKQYTNHMRYPAKHYARAFAECIHDRMTSAEKDALVMNFIASIRKHGDSSKLSSIFKETAKMLRKKTGAREVLIEAARPLKSDPAHVFKGLIGPHDTVETHVAPELVAGVKITVDGEREFDMTLARKLTQLFS